MRNWRPDFSLRSAVLVLVALEVAAGLAAPAFGSPAVVPAAARSVHGSSPVLTARGLPEPPFRPAVAPRALVTSSEDAWWNISDESPTAAPIFWFTQGTWDSADRYLMFYGGDDFQGTNLAETWTYSGGAWAMINTTGSPGPLDGPAMAYDPPAGDVVMFGGVQSYSPFRFTNLTWSYSDGNWTSQQLVPSPPPRTAASMTYDPDLGGVVLFGGYDNRDPSGATLLNDLWLFKGGAWSEINATNPPGVRTWAPIAFDATHHDLVVYSGITAAFTCIGDTWTFSNSSWTEAPAASGGPPDSCANALGYDPALGQVVLTGGLNSSTGANYDTTYGFNGTAWNLLNVSGSPGNHTYGISAWDPVDGSFVVAGGWLYYPVTDVLSIPLAVVNLTAPIAGEAGQSLAFSAGAIGGVPNRTFQWSWGDGSAPSTGPDPRHAFPGLGHFSVTVTVSDAESNVAQASASVDIVAGPSASIGTGADLGDVGVPVNFTAIVVGDASGDTYNWSFDDGGTATRTSASHAFGNPGNYTVRLRVTDPVGGNGSASVNVSIFPALTVHLVASAGADVGVPVSFPAAIAGGAPPLTYLWSFSDGGIATTLTASHRFTVSGPQTVDLQVEDAANVTANALESVAVSPALGATVTGPTSLATGATGNWSVAIQGGSAPFLVVWTFPDGSTARGPSATHAFPGTGAHAIQVEVTDALGGVANASLNVSVSAGTTPFGGSVLGVPTLALAGLGIVIVVAVVGAALYLRRRNGP
ncbi:MAG TPA: PKD domain-containing protein [Thermoplasmata archaeon]|nr:PKD domain-containing protein [Thermoplasmata archaeon]